VRSSNRYRNRKLYGEGGGKKGIGAIEKVTGRRALSGFVTAITEGFSLGELQFKTGRCYFSPKLVRLGKGKIVRIAHGTF
jgi:hypothetical protein